MDFFQPLENSLMAFLWQKSNDESWIPVELKRSAILDSGTIKFVDQLNPPAHRPTVLLYAHQFDTQQTRWILIAAPGFLVRINDERLVSGMRMLADHDAIKILQDQTIYFSKEEFARVEEFPGTEPVFCPRCKLEIKQHDLAVCCPQCSVWHHHKDQGADSCWAYTETCALCDQPTELNSSELSWSPERL